MATERVEQQLAAILAMDVVGYSRLARRVDEEGTHVRLKGHLRAVIDPKVTDHRGRIVKNTGDGVLVEFASVVDAVRCAVEVQRGMAERNTDVPQDNGSSFASAFTSVILSSQMMISLVMGSILRYVWKG